MEHINVISAAANAIEVTYPDGTVKELVVVDSCHFGRNMSPIIKTLKELGCTIRHRSELGDRGQGFVNFCGEYFNRGDAYEIAKASGQPFNDQYTLPAITEEDTRPRLDSSCIRHFVSDIKDYM